MDDLDLTDKISTPEGRLLAEVVGRADPAPGLWELVETGAAAQWLPELPALRLEQDPLHRHKDVLAHTIAVVAKAPARLRVRLGALFHDVGKPRTRSFEHGGVTFRHHEVVGARMTRKRLLVLGYPDELVDDVARLVELSGRFHTFDAGWTDAAVRRYARDAGPLLGDLDDMVRSDCTTRDAKKVARLQAKMDDLETRIAQLARDDARRAERPDLDGREIMEHLGLPPGRLVGAAREHLLELRRARGALTRDEARAALDEWWASQSAAGP